MLDFYEGGQINKGNKKKRGVVRQAAEQSKKSKI